MGKVIASITTSVDGYIVGPEDGPEQRARHRGRATPLLGHGRALDVRRRRPRHRRHARPGPGVLRGVTEGMGAGIVGRNMYEAAGAWGGTNPFPGTLIVLTHRTEDQPDPSTGFLFVDGFDAALLKAARARRRRGRGARRWCRPDPAGTRRRGRRRARDLDRAGGAGWRQAALRGLRGGPRPRGAGRVELAVRHPRAVRRQAGPRRRPPRRDDGARRRHDRDAEDREERVAAVRSARANPMPHSESARAAPMESAIESADELKPRSRSVEAASIATPVRLKPKPMPAPATTNATPGQDGGCRRATPSSHSADRGTEQGEGAGEHRLLAGRPAGRAGPGPGWPVPRRRRPP